MDDLKQRVNILEDLVKRLYKMVMEGCWDESIIEDIKKANIEGTYRQ